jgi:metal-responsive CopG/Arc/MetJ family transcriptional regulator
MSGESRERNEALFRAVNERIEDASKTVPPEEQLMQFLCECDNKACAEKISATRAEYEAVRAVPTHFIVLPGHEDPEIERVVLQSERFLVVEKQGGAAQEAEKSDPRERRPPARP